jgi:hypothetical protein
MIGGIGGHEMGGAGGAAPAQVCAEIASPAPLSYPFTGIASSDYATRIIAARCHVTPTMARQIAEIIGMAGAA